MEYIAGVKVRRLRLIPDDRGWLMELLRADWEEFEQFGQAYVTTAYPGVVKAWHYHNSPTKGLVNEFYLGTINPILVKIPSMVYHGYMAVGNEMAAIANFPTALFNYENPDEYRLAHDDPSIPYTWEVRMG